jgi:hypothetical protein
LPTPANTPAGPNGPPDAAESPDGGHRHSGHGRRKRSGTAPQGPADVAVLAREAVISFLNDASRATADREAVRAGVAPADGEPTAAAAEENAPWAAAEGNAPWAGPGTAIELRAPAPAPATVPGDAIFAAGQVATGSGWGAAAIGVATLDRIEAAAAKVEADIAVALRAYADLQAGAGAAAEAAVYAAQSAMASAGVATEAERQVRISLRQVRQYVVVTVVLLVVVIIVLAEITSPVR